MSPQDDNIHMIFQNVISLTAMVITMDWSTPEGIAEWIVGTVVAVSIATYNIVRIVGYIKDRRKGIKPKKDD